MASWWPCFPVHTLCTTQLSLSLLGTCYIGCVYQLVKGKIRAGLSLKRQVCNGAHCSFKTPTYPNFLICITLNTTFILTRDRSWPIFRNDVRTSYRIATGEIRKLSWVPSAWESIPPIGYNHYNVRLQVLTTGYYGIQVIIIISTYKKYFSQGYMAVRL